MNSLKKLQQGFTLVELMVVVAIIGILSAVAIPNFKKYQAKSKTSEAKLQLSSIYAAETAFMADADTYGTCLGDMGYDPTAEAGARYYTTGFTLAYSPSGGFNGVPCTPATKMNFPAGKKVGNTSATTAALNRAAPANPTVTTGVTNNGGSFMASAAGIIDTGNVTDATSDLWSVNENKFFQHNLVGY